jgi:hypothetical protein
MSKRLQAPTSRLICIGGAKALTFASNIGEPEFDVGGPQELA